MAFPTGWGRHAVLEIQASQVDADQVDYPLLLTEVSLPLSMFDADGSAPALNGGGDIRFSLDSDGSTQLACEVVTFSTDNDPNNGNAEIWVKVPSLSSSTDTIIYIWYSKADEVQPLASDTYGSENVWDSNFKGVWHLNQDPSSTAPQELDSTINNNDGTSNGSMTLSDLVDGKIAKALDFDGSDDYIDTGYEEHTLLSVSALIYDKDTTKSLAMVISNEDGADNFAWGIRVDAGELKFYLKCADYVNISGGTIQQNEWYHVVGVFDRNGGTNNYKIYVNGGLSNQGTLNEDLVEYGNIVIGRVHHSTADEYFIGIIDEVRISNVVRSAAWITANSRNQHDPASFVVPVLAPSIVSASIAPNDFYVKLTFSIDVWSDSSQSTTISKDDFEVIFSQNPNAGGLTTGAQIEDLYTSSTLDTKLAAGTGYSEVYAKLTLFGDSPAGVETIEIKPASASAIYGSGGAMPSSETSGVLTFNPAPSVTLDWSSFDLAMSEFNSILSILLPSLFGHGLHVFFTDKSLFQQVKAELYSRISSLPSDDQSLAVDLLNFFQRFYGR